MKKKYIFTEEDIEEALKEKFLDKDKLYNIKIKQIETENYYGYKYKTIVAEATELNDYN